MGDDLVHSRRAVWKLQEAAGCLGERAGAEGSFVRGHKHRVADGGRAVALHGQAGHPARVGGARALAGAALQRLAAAVVAGAARVFARHGHALVKGAVKVLQHVVLLLVRQLQRRQRVVHAFLAQSAVKEKRKRKKLIIILIVDGKTIRRQRIIICMTLRMHERGLEVEVKRKKNTMKEEKKRKKK